MGIYVQYGCGWSAPDEWINFDASPTLKFERTPILGRLYTKNENRFPNSVRYGDIVQGLPIESGSVDGIYASHVLEHLSRNDCFTAIKNTFNLLKSGGTFRLVVPDLESRAREYLQSLDEGGGDKANDVFMRGSHLGKENRVRGLFQSARESLGHSAHLWMWDEASMMRALKETGFVDIRRCEFNDASDEMFKLVEEEARFYWSPPEQPSKRYHECAIEAIRP